MDGLTVQFEQLTLDWCYSCWRAEPIPPSGAYVTCFECGHVYETANDLLIAYNDMVEGLNSVMSSIGPINWAENAEGILLCPLCMHDL